MQTFQLLRQQSSGLRKEPSSGSRLKERQSYPVAKMLNNPLKTPTAGGEAAAWVVAEIDAMKQMMAGLKSLALRAT
jgi:hypothetical protein